MEFRKGQSHPLFHVLWQGQSRFPGGGSSQRLFIINNGASSTWSHFSRIQHRFQRFRGSSCHVFGR